MNGCGFAAFLVGCLFCVSIPLFGYIPFNIPSVSSYILVCFSYCLDTSRLPYHVHTPPVLACPRSGIPHCHPCIALPAYLPRPNREVSRIPLFWNFWCLVVCPFISLISCFFRPWPVYLGRSLHQSVRSWLCFYPRFFEVGRIKSRSAFGRAYIFFSANEGGICFIFSYLC